MTAAQRPLAAVPRGLRWLPALALALQVAWQLGRPAPLARAEDLPAPPPQPLLAVAALGDPVALARGLMLWLQAFDNQPGISIPFRELDYARVIAWLDRILVLDPLTQYPLLAAARLYAEVPDPPRQRLMLAFVQEKFLEDPDRRWPWLAHAVLVAQHRLKDPELALKFARRLADNGSEDRVPAWARQMHIFVLEDMGELEAARIVIGGLLDSGRITDPHEFRFLKDQLDRLQEQRVAPGPAVPDELAQRRQLTE